ncbi:hypothetical protein AD939_00595 [Gluconobacter oxydans]|nr:hypothetical protein AD939_00595 [Gluconobacter oxydans]
MIPGFRYLVFQPSGIILNQIFKIFEMIPGFRYLVFQPSGSLFRFMKWWQKCHKQTKHLRLFIK